MSKCRLFHNWGNWKQENQWKEIFVPDGKIANPEYMKTGERYAKCNVRKCLRCGKVEAYRI